MYYYVYLIKATNDFVNKSYVGYTNNLKMRIIKHNSNRGAKSTKGYKWILIYSKRFKTKNSAMSFEYKFKKNYNLRKKIINRFCNDEKH
jgi:putative endonuclease